MRVWTCSDAKGHYPVGFAAVIVATDEIEAQAQFAMAMLDEGLDPYSGHLIELDLTTVKATILVNGDY